MDSHHHASYLEYNSHMPLLKRLKVAVVASCMFLLLIVIVIVITSSLSRIRVSNTNKY
jgi:hypothetical protein